MTGINKCGIVIFLVLILPNLLNAQQIAVPEGRRLRDIVADKFPDGNLIIGGTTGEWAFGSATGQIMDREFSYVTPENDFKQPQIHPDNSEKWTWNRPDNWKSHVLENQQKLRMHGPISPQCSNWAKDDSRTARELETNMRAFMQALCERYNGQANFEYMDVVNETVINGDWHKNKAGTGWEVPWFIIGQDTDENKTPLYIKYAFEIASQHAPDVKLLFNQHERTLITSSWDLIKKTIKYLRDQGLRVDAIGWQAHLEAGWEKVEGQTQILRELIDWAHQNNLEFHITEQSVYINSNSETEYKKQADTYRAVIDILIEKSENGKVGWNTWHIDDGHGSQTDKFPALFNKDYQAKPAYYAIQRALETKSDYSKLYNILVKVKNTESGQAIENCKVLFNNEIKYTDNNGEILFESPANEYNLETIKNHYYSRKLENLSIYSDTIFNMVLDSAEVLYKVKFEVEDAKTADYLSSVNIEINSIIQKTDEEGKAEFILKPGIYAAGFEKLNYTSLQSDFNINSDTTINVTMNRSLADFKFRIKSNNQPINDAMVVFGKDTMFSNTLGICTFKSYPIDSTFHYKIMKEYYASIEGSLFTKSDSTIDIQLQKNVANIEFVLSSDKEKIENATLIVFNDTIDFNSDRIAKLYNVKKETEFSFQILSKNYPDYTDIIIPESDTTIYVHLVYSSLKHKLQNNLLKIYPNPAKEFLILENDSEINFIEIFTSGGTKTREIQMMSNYKKLDISDLPVGFYFINVVSKYHSESHSFIKIE